MDQRISVLMSVYKNDIADNVKVAVESVINQTLPPEQVVMVVDGPVPDELKTMLEKLDTEYPILELVWLPENVGAGEAVRIGTDYCKYPFIARMDSDDIALPTRFEKEMAYFTEHPDVDMVGSSHQEFYDQVSDLAGFRDVPETHEAIVEFMKKRNPFCQPSVIMKKEALIRAGGYQSYRWVEDWYLWIRMYLSGTKFYNFQEPLMLIRVNRNTYARRQGLKYYRNIKGILKYMRQHKMLSFWQYTKAKFVRFVGHVLVPAKMKTRLYRKYLRSKPVAETNLG